MKFSFTLPHAIAPIWAVLAAFLVGGCASYFESKTGNGQAILQARSVPSFSRIELVGNVDLHVAVGPASSVVVNSDANLQPVIETTVSNDTLRIRQTQSYSSAYCVAVNVTAPSLSSLTVCGSGDAHLTGFAGTNFTLGISGSSDVGLEGNLSYADFSLNGSGSIHAPDLLVQNLKLVVNGSGTTVVHVSNRLDVLVNGSAHVSYIGRPDQLQQQLNGSGSIEQQ